MTTEVSMKMCAAPLLSEAALIRFSSTSRPLIWRGESSAPSQSITHTLDHANDTSHYLWALWLKAAEWECASEHISPVHAGTRRISAICRRMDYMWHFAGDLWHLWTRLSGDSLIQTCLSFICCVKKKKYTRVNYVLMWSSKRLFVMR